MEIPYWGQSLLRVLGGIVAVLLPAGTIVYVFLFKMMSFMQSRLGPMEAGPYGSMQLFAEVGKWLQKEDTAPEAADHRIFKMAPLIVLVSTFLLVAAVPFGPDVWLTNFEVGVFYALAVSSISVLGILVAGWASANKYSLLGGLRAAGQLIAYELPLVLGTLGVVIQAGSMNMQEIVVAQNSGADLRLGRPRQPVHPHPVHRLLRVHGRRPGRADAAAVRHADRRVRARRRLHDRVLRLPLPDLLHRRVRHRRRVLADRLGAVPRRVGRARSPGSGGTRSTRSTTG